MFDSKKLIKISIIMTDIFMCVLLFFVIFLPSGISWYVEVMKRSQDLPATVMVTCYPCAPFVAICLLSLRSILKSTLKSNLFCDKNYKHLRNISISCVIVSIITLIAGGYYLPFYIVAGTFAFLALITFSINSIFRSVDEQINKTE